MYSACTHIGRGTLSTSTLSSFSIQSAVSISSKREYEHPRPSLFNVLISSTLPVTVLIDQANRTCFGVSTSPRFTSLTIYCAKDHVSLLTRAEGSCLSESRAFRNCTNEAGGGKCCAFSSSGWGGHGCLLMPCFSCSRR